MEGHEKLFVKLMLVLKVSCLNHRSLLFVS